MRCLVNSASIFLDVTSKIALRWKRCAGQSVINSSEGICRDNICLSRIPGEGLVVATGKFHCWSEMMFGFTKDTSVCNNGCFSQEKAMGCLCSQFMVTASPLYEPGGANQGCICHLECLIATVEWLSDNE